MQTLKLSRAHAQSRTWRGGVAPVGIGEMAMVMAQRVEATGWRPPCGGGYKGQSYGYGVQDNCSDDISQGFSYGVGGAMQRALEQGASRIMGWCPRVVFQQPYPMMIRHYPPLGAGAVPQPCLQCGTQFCPAIGAPIAQTGGNGQSSPSQSTGEAAKAESDSEGSLHKLLEELREERNDGTPRKRDQAMDELNDKLKETDTIFEMLQKHGGLSPRTPPKKAQHECRVSLGVEGWSATTGSCFGVAERGAACTQATGSYDSRVEGAACSTACMNPPPHPCIGWV